MKNEDLKKETEWKRYKEGKRMIGISYWTALDIIPSVKEQQKIKNEIVEVLRKHAIKHYCIVDEELLSEVVKEKLLLSEKDSNQRRN